MPPSPCSCHPSGALADGTTRGFLDFAPTFGGTQTTSPWVAVAAGAAALTGLVALLNYLDRKDRR